jgi:hypothetical protein
MQAFPHQSILLHRLPRTLRLFDIGDPEGVFPQLIRCVTPPPSASSLHVIGKHSCYRRPAAGPTDHQNDSDQDTNAW